MTSKCANPRCGRAFYKLAGGRLFRFDLRQHDGPCKDVPEFICAQNPKLATVYFWLCPDCAPRFGVSFSPRQGLRIIPAPVLPVAPRLANQTRRTR